MKRKKLPKALPKLTPRQIEAARKKWHKMIEKDLEAIRQSEIITGDPDVYAADYGESRLGSGDCDACAKNRKP